MLKNKKEKLTLWYKSKFKNVNKEKLLVNIFVNFIVGLALMLIKHYLFNI